MDKNIENNPMNHNIFAEQWKQMRGTLKSWWASSLLTSRRSPRAAADELVRVRIFFKLVQY